MEWAMGSCFPVTHYQLLLSTSRAQMSDDCKKDAMVWGGPYINTEFICVDRRYEP